MAWTNRRRCIHIAFLAALGLVTTACHTKRPPPPPSDVTPGSTLRILVPYPVTNTDRSAYFQDSTLRRRGDLGAVNPYCRFTAPASAIDTSMANVGTFIGKGTYTVQSSEYDAREKGPGNRIVSAVGYTLSGPRPGDTAKLHCVVPDVSANDRFPTPPEIVGALGSYFELKLAQ